MAASCHYTSPYPTQDTIPPAPSLPSPCLYLPFPTGDEELEVVGADDLPLCQCLWGEGTTVSLGACSRLREPRGLLALVLSPGSP